VTPTFVKELRLCMDRAISKGDRLKSLSELVDTSENLNATIRRGQESNQINNYMIKTGIWRGKHTKRSGHMMRHLGSLALKAK